MYCDLGENEFGPNFLKCLSLCKKSKLSQREVDHIVSQLPEMCRLFMRDSDDPMDMQGSQLTELEMDNLGIPKHTDSSDRRTAAKDGRPQCQQRAILLTGKSSRRRRNKFLERQREKEIERERRREEKIARENLTDAELHELREAVADAKADAKAVKKRQAAEDKSAKTEAKAEAKAVRERKAAEDKIAKAAAKEAKDREKEAKSLFKKRKAQMQSAAQAAKVAKCVIGALNTQANV